MKYYALDFETYYGKDLSLRTSTYEVYATHPSFEVIGVSIVTDVKKGWITGVGAESFIRELSAKGFFTDPDRRIVCHNAMFDGSILLHHFGIRATNLVCTQAMATTVLGESQRVSLAKTADFLIEAGVAIEHKGEEVAAAFGKHLRDFSKEDLAQYGEYCMNDSQICLAAYHFFAKYMTEEEILFQQQVLATYTYPTLTTDRPLLLQEKERLRVIRETLYNKLMEQHQLGSHAEVITMLRGRASFPKLLQDEYGIKVGLKPSKTAKNEDGTAKMTLALAKGDEFMQELLEHDNPEVQLLASAKLTAGSTIAETRVDSFLRWNNLGYLCTPYKVSGAHTYRLSGTQGINVQNLPTARTGSDALRRSIRPRNPAHSLVVADYSQVEVRTGKFIAGDKEGNDLLGAGFDPYLMLASKMFNIPLEEITEMYKAGDEHTCKVKRPFGKAGVLGCGYGVGAGKAKLVAKMMAGLTLTDEEASNLVTLYRASEPLTVKVWNDNKDVITALLERVEGYKFFGYDGQLFETVVQKVGRLRIPGILLPDGNVLKYDQIHRRKEDNPERIEQGFRETVEYMGRNGWVSIYGAKLFENQNQALAMCIAKHHIVEISKQMRGLAKICLNTHDEIGVVCKTEDTAEVAKEMTRIMCTPPEYLKGIPLNVSIDIGKNYC